MHWRDEKHAELLSGNPKGSKQMAEKCRRIL